MNTLNLFSSVAALLVLATSNAQDGSHVNGIKNARTVTVAVSGDCPMCEKTIEKVAFVKGEATADWDVDAKTAQITFDSTRTNLDAVLKRIALAGYDNERYLAPEAAYAALPGCCQYERSLKPSTAAEPAHDHNAHVATPVAQNEAGPFDAVLAAYFQLKDALVASDATAAKKKAVALDGIMHSVDATSLTPELQGTWTEVMKAVMEHLHPLGTTDDLEKQRALFAKLTPGMLQLVKAAPTAQPVYLDHCPMYSGGADWLSREQAIKNPYYGAAMLSCGRVKETIAK